MFAPTGEFPLFHTPAGATRRRATAVSAWRVGVALAIAITVGTAWPRSHAVRAPLARVAASDASKSGVIKSFHRRGSHHGRYAAEVVAASPLTTGADQSWTIRLADSGEPLANARVSADVWMPETGEHSSTHPSVRRVGGGDYRIEGLAFARAGWWNVALVIDGRSGVDSVAFNVVLPGRD
jgi:YtkA-like